MKKVYMYADSHGEFKTIKYKLNYRKDCIIIQLGDFGWFNDSQISKIKDLNRFLKVRNIKMYVIRGNHDNPIYFDGGNRFSNIFFLEDYTVLNINNTNILCIGGAISVDRSVRKENISYWKDEVFVYNEEKINSLKDIDIVCSHTCHEISPLMDNGVVTYYSFKDNELRKDLEQEKEDFSKFIKEVRNSNDIKAVYHGHFHQKWDIEKDGINYHSLIPHEMKEI